MNIHILSFSPTGGTQKILDFITESMEISSRIDLSVQGENYSQYHFGGDDVCIIGVPSFGGRVPAICMGRLKQMRGANTPVVLVVSYGNRHIDDTLMELKTELSAVGFRTVAACSAIAEHSIMRVFATGRPDEKDAAELGAFGAQLSELFPHMSDTLEISVPGNTPYKPLGITMTIPETSDLCTGCGICAPLCPVGAIPTASPSETDKTICMGCMRCISVCPQGARALNTALLEGVIAKLGPLCAGRKENSFYIEK